MSNDIYKKNKKNMIKQITTYIYLTTILVLINSSFLFSEITIKADKNNVFIGDRINVKVSLKYPKNASVDYSFLTEEKFGEFELIPNEIKNLNDIKQNKIVSSDGSFITEEKLLVYTTFADSGDYYLGPFKFNYLVDSLVHTELSDSIKISVHSILKSGAKIAYLDSLGNKQEMPLDSLKNILPIKDIQEYELSSEEKQFITWVIVGVIVLIIVIILLIRASRKKKNLPPIIKKKIKIIPAHIIALEKLKILQERGLLKKGDYKEYSVEISSILRNYLENRYKFIAAELTTYDLKIEVEKYVEEREILEYLSKFLDLTDLVKFAKFIPLDGELKQLFESGKEFIEKTKEVEVIKKKNNNNKQDVK